MERRMVISRIRKHVITFNWFAVFIDLLIVGVGVFLGTQANNWNEARLERAAAADYRREIITDLKANELDLTWRKTYSEAVRKHAIAALAVIESPGRQAGEAFLVDAYQASQVWARPLTRTAYDEMIGAGLSRSMGSQETRSRLTAYFTQIKQFDVTATAVTSYRDRLRRALPYAIQAKIRTRCGDRVTTLRSGAQISSLPDQCVLGLSPAEISTAVARLRPADLHEDLTRQIADLDQKIGGYQRFLELAKNLRLRLHAEDE
jgi:hypothetical protein